MKYTYARLISGEEIIGRHVTKSGNDFIVESPVEMKVMEMGEKINYVFLGPFYMFADSEKPRIAISRDHAIIMTDDVNTYLAHQYETYLDSLDDSSDNIDMEDSFEEDPPTTNTLH